MNTPAAEWALGVGYLAVLDVLRARGEADGDTLSEVTRDLVNRQRALSTVVYVAGAVALYRHIFRRKP